MLEKIAVSENSLEIPGPNPPCCEKDPFWLRITEKEGMFAFQLHKIIAGQHDLSGVPSKEVVECQLSWHWTEVVGPGEAEFQPQ